MILRDWLLALSCLAAGACGSFAFDPFRWGIWATPMLAYSVLLAATFDASPKKAAFFSYLFAAAHFGLGLSWTHNSLHVFGGIPIFLAVLLSIMLALFLALFHSASAWVGRKVAGDSKMALSLACLVASWVLFEHARTWAFTGFGWLAIGYSQLPRSALSGFVPILGAFGTTAICGIVAALCTSALLQQNHLRSFIPLALVALIAATGWGLRNVRFTQPVGEPFTASVLQGAVPQHRQWISENFHTLPDRYHAMSKRAKGSLLVTPESAFPFDWESFLGTPLERYQTLMKERGSHIIIGTFTNPEGSKKSRNSAVVLSPEGEVATYSKRHLLPYGEYLPFPSMLEPMLQRAKIPYSSLGPGTGDGIIKLPFATLGMSICYESLFPRLFSAPPAEVLVNLTNDSWFDGTAMPAQHLQVSMARALETGRWMIRASNTGPSAIISPEGRVAKYAAPLIRAVRNHEVVPMGGATPYAMLGDWPTLLAALSVLAGTAFHIRRK